MRLSKRMSFAARQRRRRAIRRVERANAGRRGFVGVVSHFAITLPDGTTQSFDNLGALFVGTTRAVDPDEDHDAAWALGEYDNDETGCPNCGRFRLCLCPNGKHRCEKCDWCPEDGAYVPNVI